MNHTPSRKIWIALALALLAGTGFCEDTGRGDEDERLVLGEEDLAERGEIARNMFRRITPGDEPLVQDVGTWPVAWEEFAPNWAAAAVGREYGAWVVPFSLAQESGTTVIRDANDTVLWRGETDFAKPESASVTLVGGLVAEEEWDGYEAVRDFVENVSRQDVAPVPSRGVTYTNGLRFTSLAIDTNGTVELSLAWEEDGDVDIFAYLLSGIPSTNVVTWTNDENQVVTTTNTVWEIIGENLSGFDNAWEWRGMASVTNGEGIFTDSGAAANPVRMGFYAAAEANDTDGDGLNDGFESLVHHTDPDKEDTDGDGWCDAAELSAGFDPLDAASFPRVVIQAVRYKLPAGETVGEWIELYSASTQPVDLSGASLAIGIGPDWEWRVGFAPGTVIQPGRCLLIGDGAVTNADVAVEHLGIPDSGPHLDLTGVRLEWDIQDTRTVGDTVFIGGRATPFNDRGLDSTGWNSTSSVWCAAGSIVERRYAGIDTDTVGDWTWNPDRPGRNTDDIIDSDGDGLTDGEEWTGVLNPYGEPTNPWNADSDGDGLNDCTECVTNRTNPNAWSTMGDIWPWAPTNGSAVATNWPGSDPWKILHGIDPTNAVATTNGFPAYWEELLDGPGSLASGVDSDGDGIDNATEIRQNSNPQDPADSDPKPYVVRFESSRPDWENGTGFNDVGLYGKVRMYFQGAATGQGVFVRVEEGGEQFEDFTLHWENADITAISEEATNSQRFTSAVLSERSSLVVQDDGTFPQFPPANAGGEYTITDFTATLVPDFNHDRTIDAADCTAIYRGNPFRFWINDDNDDGPIGDETNNIPGNASGYSDWRDDEVDGECDLADFFPIWLDIHDLLLHLPAGISCRLRHADGAVNAVYTDLQKADCGDYLVNTNRLYGPGFDSPPHGASVFRVTRTGVELSEEFIAKAWTSAAKPVLLFEGRSATTNPLVFEARMGGEPIFCTQMHLSVSNVESLYEWIDFRTTNEPSVSLATDKANVFFVHGANVTTAGERAWAAEMFKRLWWSGADMAFWPVKWASDEGLPWSYHENVENAFEVAVRFGSLLSGSGGRNVVLAHSLGTVVAAAAVQNYSAQVDKLLMFNSAIPSEAFDSTLFDCSTNNHLVHNDWVEYTNTCWTARWHELFPVGDARHDLTWRGRFASVAPIAVNFYSSGDEVLELYEDAHNPAWYNGLSPSGNWGDRYSWHKQELWKGRWSILGLAVVGTTDWSGWGFKETALGARVWSAAEANAVTDPQVFATNTVFDPTPASITNATATRLEKDAHLAYGIPALSPATGRTQLNSDVMTSINTDTTEYKVNTWPRPGNTGLNGRFLHSDIKDVAYLFIYPVFDSIVEIGDLNP